MALDRARNRLGTRASEIHWIVADVTANPDLGSFDVWHDRAVFHFLITSVERAAYTALLMRTVPVGGHAIIATFALAGWAGAMQRARNAALRWAHVGYGIGATI